MSTITTTNRSSSLNIVVALAIMLVVIVAFAVAQSLVGPKSALIPVTGSQNAYVEFLLGEKTMYANPVGLSDALSAYHLGEKSTISVVESKKHIDECFDVSLSELASCRSESQAPATP